MIREFSRAEAQLGTEVADPSSVNRTAAKFALSKIKTYGIDTGSVLSHQLYFVKSITPTDPI